MLFRIQSSTNYLTTASMGQRWTTCCTLVTSLRRQGPAHPAVWCLKCRTSSVSASQQPLCVRVWEMWYNSKWYIYQKKKRQFVQWYKNTAKYCQLHYCTPNYGGIALCSFSGRCKKRKQEEEGSTEAGILPEGGVMRSQAEESPLTPCGCKASGSSLIGGSGAGWEGTALLHHGSYIKLGCLQFVFSITEFASKQPKEEDAATAIGCGPTPNPSQQGELLAKPTPQIHQVPVLHHNPVP